MLQNKPVKNNQLLVGFDARMVAYRQAGIGQYCLNLLRGLAPLQTTGEGFKLVVYQSRKEKRSPVQWLFESGSPDAVPLAKRVLWTPSHNRFEQLALPLELLPGGPAVFHSPDFVPPLRRWAWGGLLPHRIASVITIHDLAFLQFPHLLSAESAGYYGQVKQAAHSAERIIAVSESTARDIIERLEVAPEKVRVVYEATNPLYRPLEPLEIERLASTKAQAVAGRLLQAGIGPAELFLLFVSTLEPRKNLPTLLKAYRQVCDRLGDAAPKLVLAGREGWLFQEVYALAETLQLGDNLVWLGEVSTEDLWYLYNRAAVLAMPSLYEGFGLPPLEALACGCPVLVAATSSLPEVVGPYGVSLPSLDVAEWAGALSQHWFEREANRARLLESGPKWVTNFSWKRAARETLAIYREAWQS